MCGCNGGGMSSSSPSYYSNQGPTPLSTARPGQVAYEYEVTHPAGIDPPSATFTSDVDAYRDMARYPGSRLAQIRIVA